MFWAKVVEKIKTHILCSVAFESRDVYEIMWKNIVEPNSSQMTMWHMCIVCWIPKATNTHSDYITHAAFSLQQWLDKCTLALCCLYIACVADYHYLKCRNLTYNHMTSVHGCCCCCCCRRRRHHRHRCCCCCGGGGLWRLFDGW